MYLTFTEWIFDAYTDGVEERRGRSTESWSLGRCSETLQFSELFHTLYSNEQNQVILFKSYLFYSTLLHLLNTPDAYSHLESLQPIFVLQLGHFAPVQVEQKHSARFLWLGFEEKEVIVDLTGSSLWLTKARGERWLLPGQLLPRLLHFVSAGLLLPPAVCFALLPIA